MITVQEFRKTGGKELSRFEMSDDGILTIHLTPMGKPRMTQRDKWDKRACAAGYEMGDSLYVDFHLPMAKSWSKKKKAEKLGTKHDQKPDIDNMAKAVMDSLSKDDKEVNTLFARKYWSENGQPGKITIYPTEAIFLYSKKM